jgi:hypothetical protein
MKIQVFWAAMLHCMASSYRHLAPSQCFWNMGNYLPNNTASHARRPECSAVLWEPGISHGNYIQTAHFSHLIIFYNCHLVLHWKTQHCGANIWHQKQHLGVHLLWQVTSLYMCNTTWVTPLVWETHTIWHGYQCCHVFSVRYVLRKKNLGIKYGCQIWSTKD